MIPGVPNPQIGYGNGRHRSRRYLLDLCSHEHAVAKRAVETMRLFDNHQKDCISLHTRFNCDCGFTEFDEALREIEASGWKD